MRDSVGSMARCNWEMKPEWVLMEVVVVVVISFLRTGIGEESKSLNRGEWRGTGGGMWDFNSSFVVKLLISALEQSSEFGCSCIIATSFLFPRENLISADDLWTTPLLMKVLGWDCIKERWVGDREYNCSLPEPGKRWYGDWFVAITVKGRRSKREVVWRKTERGRLYNSSQRIALLDSYSNCFFTTQDPSPIPSFGSCILIYILGTESSQYNGMVARFVLVVNLFLAVISRRHSNVKSTYISQLRN
jgi:hypothetical protein